ncbi:MAG: hypothetical protein ACUVQF_02080 [Fervidobacterium sp.]|uniref:hypothetical protein n=1 Tax=Fervidobacterium sp. TaxID=1871331 RepID=UPI004049FE39
MVYTEILYAMLVLMLLLTIIATTIPAQREILNESIRQEKAQIIAENMFWETVDATYLQNLPDNKFILTYYIDVDGHRYKVDIKAIKFDRPEN